MKQNQLKVLGMDPSLNNWGLAHGLLDMVTGILTIQNIDVIQVDPPKGKQVRQNSKDLYVSQELFSKAYQATEGSQITFAEVPVGSQSARAMTSYGVCIGVLGSLRGIGRPFFELTPTEVKLASVGHKTATKKEMIQWAMDVHPEANWPIYKKNGEFLVSEAKAEHMADAIAAIYAGVKSDMFKQYKNIIYANQSRTA